MPSSEEMFLCNVTPNRFHRPYITGGLKMDLPLAQVSSSANLTFVFIRNQKSISRKFFFVKLISRKKIHFVDIIGHKYKVLKHVEKHVTKVTLVILDVSLRDFGSYSCVAKNPLGESDGTIKLSGTSMQFLKKYDECWYFQN